MRGSPHWPPPPGEVLPERVPAEGLLILRDGEPAEAEEHCYAVQEELAMAA
jgi:hypothetical protein